MDSLRSTSYWERVRPARNEREARKRIGQTTAANKLRACGALRARAPALPAKSGFSNWPTRSFEIVGLVSGGIPLRILAQSRRHSAVDRSQTQRSAKASQRNAKPWHSELKTAVDGQLNVW
ncbi:MAG TPA: hypothetical protein DHU55_04060 [Blastocatellia bacterium]|nr:hypothetical protein [Blastocatellia bacterium]HAF23558.1 hypothetical protein [Blastocatellia bacterium]HCX28934.1 hypothetical protein [Blastocatellia bacterium]